MELKFSNGLPNPLTWTLVDLPQKAHEQVSITIQRVFELWDRVAKEWDEIPSETCQSLIESMQRRIYAVLKAKGGHTKY